MTDLILFLIFYVLINELIKLGAMEYSGLLHDVWLWYLSMLRDLHYNNQQNQWGISLLLFHWLLLPW